MKEAAEIIQDIPHRYPFLMVDRVLELVPGRRAVAVKNITTDTLFTASRGQYSPELFVIEAMAQVGAIAAAADGTGDGARSGGPVSGYLAALNGVVFRKRPKVGDRVHMTLVFEARVGALVRFRGTAMIGDETSVEAGLTFTVPHPETTGHTPWSL